MGFVMCVYIYMGFVMCVCMYGFCNEWVYVWVL